MSCVPDISPAPVGQQGPPTRVAAFDSCGHSATRMGPSDWLREAYVATGESLRDRAEIWGGKRGNLNISLDNVNS